MLLLLLKAIILTVILSAYVCCLRLKSHTADAHNEYMGNFLVIS